MDVVWDQDVRTALSAIIGREPVENQSNDDKVKGHIQLAIRYADELGKARGVAERRPSREPAVQFRRGGR